GQGQGGNDALRPDQGAHHLPHEIGGPPRSMQTKKGGHRPPFSQGGPRPAPHRLRNRPYTVAGSSFSGSACTSSTISPSTTSTPTRPPLTSLPNSSSSASGRLILSCSRRAIGRAPIS